MIQPDYIPEATLQMRRTLEDCPSCRDRGHRRPLLYGFVSNTEQAFLCGECRKTFQLGGNGMEEIRIEVAA